MLSPHNFWPPHNFGAIDPPLSSFEAAQFVVVPVPYDATTTWRAGTREGPAAIIEASMNLELFDVELRREIQLCGIHTTSEVEVLLSRPEEMAVRITEVIGEILLAGKVPVMLGGDHSLSYGAVCAAVKLNLPGTLSVLQLDAHTDLRDSYCGTRYGHGSVARRISTLLKGVEVVQAGLRSSSAQECTSVPPNVKQFWCEDMLQDFDAALVAIVDSLADDVYITFDVDVCDPSWMPATGTPEPGGLGFYQVRDLLRAVCTRKRVVGVDCVELLGGDPAAAFATARLLYKVMGYLSR